MKETVADPAFKNLHDLETGVVVDMFLTLRDVKAHKEMIELYQRMPEPLQRARIVREQYGFALNREGRAQEATAVLKAVIEEFGPSSETNGLLGRVYKDQWDNAKKTGAGALQVRGLLKLAAETYLAGFQADWRDAYPGVNAVTLMELMDTPPPIQAEILPVVRFSAAQKAKASGDYWDYATLMELAVLARDENGAMEQAEVALTKAQFGWHLETTERQLAPDPRNARRARRADSMDQGSGGRAGGEARTDGGAEGILDKELIMTIMYHDGNRRLQDEFESRRIADRLEEKLTRTKFTDDDKAFIEGAVYFFVATADADGRPDCSFKGGMPGFVRVTGPSELAFPDYDGNGMFKSLGNLTVNPNVGLLFIALHDKPKRLRINGSAVVRRDDPLLAKPSVRN